MMEQLEGLEQMKDEDAIKAIGERLVLVEEELGLPSGSHIRETLAAMRVAMETKKLHAVKIRRWFGVALQLRRVEETWSTYHALMEMQLDQDSKANTGARPTRTKGNLQQAEVPQENGQYDYFTLFYHFFQDVGHLILIKRF